MKIDPSSSFEHLCSNGVRATASRCDLRGGVVLAVPHDATVDQVAEGAARVFGYHAANILPDLPAFSGYDTVRVTVARY